MKKILVIDGGGLKGIIPAIVVNRIEQLEGKPCSQIFDLICGTSTGSVIGGVLAAGVKGETVEKLYCKRVPQLFTPRNRLLPKNWLIAEKYDRQPFISDIDKYTNKATLEQLKTLFLTTAFNLCSGRTHFFKSDDKIDRFLYLSQVVSWSALSAVAYFGKINVAGYRWKNYLPDGNFKSEMGAVFQDGGQGTQNSPVMIALIEAFIRWPKEDIHMVSIGCGDQDVSIPYSKASKSGILKQIFSFLGQARNESSVMQLMGAIAVDAMLDKFIFQRFNVTISDKLDALDGKKYVKDYIQLGRKLADQYIK